MKVGLVGFAGSGKTTLFNAMTGLDAPAGFGGEVRLGTVKVPDPRVDALSKAFSPRKTTWATVNFRDLPGDHGAGGRVLSTSALQNLRDQEALCLVVRDFASSVVEGAPDPPGEAAAFREECVLADLGIVERRLDRARKERADSREIAAFETMTESLSAGTPLRRVPTTKLHRRFLKGYGLLTDLPLLIAVNRDEDRAAEPVEAALAAEIKASGGAEIVLSAQVEAEIAALGPADQEAFLADLGLGESTLDRFVRAAYGLMDLISFLTTGEDEVRAWPIRRGTTARVAAGRIHSDLERGFIRAEVLPYDAFAEFGSEKAAKEAGKVRVEGKDYVVEDGDILHVRFNV